MNETRRRKSSRTAPIPQLLPSHTTLTAQPKKNYGPPGVTIAPCRPQYTHGYGRQHSAWASGRATTSTMCIFIRRWRGSIVTNDDSRVGLMDVPPGLLLMVSPVFSFEKHFPNNFSMFASFLRLSYLILRSYQGWLAVPPQFQFGLASAHQ